MPYHLFSASICGCGIKVERNASFSVLLQVANTGTCVDVGCEVLLLVQGVVGKHEAQKICLKIYRTLA